MYTKLDNTFGIVGLQTDDTLILADEGFASAEESKIEEAGFMSKPREELTADKPLTFNGGIITLCTDGKITLQQPKYSESLRLVMEKPVDSTSSRGTVRQQLSTKDQYVAQRARGAYLATVSQPEAAFDLSFAAQMSTEPTKEDVKLLNQRIK